MSQPHCSDSGTATAHAASHAIAAAIYAATAIRDVTLLDVAVDKERDWQYQHLLTLMNNAN